MLSLSVYMQDANDLTWGKLNAVQGETGLLLSDSFSPLKPAQMYTYYCSNYCYFNREAFYYCYLAYLV